MILPADVFGFKMGMTLEEVNKQCSTKDTNGTIHNILGTANTILFDSYTIQDWLDDKFPEHNVTTTTTIATQANSDSYQVYEVKPLKPNSLFNSYRVGIDDNHGVDMIAACTSEQKFESTGAIADKLINIVKILSYDYGQWHYDESEGIFFFDDKLPDNLLIIMVSSSDPYYDNGLFGFFKGYKASFRITYMFKNYVFKND